MTELTRRTALAGAGATALAPAALTSFARAAAPAAGKQAPGFYRYKVGEFEVTVITDGARSFPLPETLVRNAKKDEVNAALEKAFLPKDTMTIPFNPVVVNTGSKLVLIDTGNGPGAFEQSKGAVGQVHTNLAAAGIDRNAIDAVIISHFHGDHINGLLTADGKPAFANAEVLVPAAEWKYWADDGEMSKAAGNQALEGNFKNVKRVFGALGNKVTQYEPGKELITGITSHASYGHTPGHTSHIVSSGSAKIMVQADVTNRPELFAVNPGWHFMFDMDGPVAEGSRRKLYDMLAAEKMMVQGFHYAFPAAGYVEKAGTGYRVVPVAWSPML
jgi:glyoxylase-like metal-dependent hydrolase (beta-lactamase superfamily II)